MVSEHQRQASELIDLIAEAMEPHRDKGPAYKAGRAILLSYYRIHPNAVYAVGQASKYILARCEMGNIP